MSKTPVLDDQTMTTQSIYAEIALFDEIKRLAKKEHRSPNSLMVLLLTEAIKQFKTGDLALYGPTPSKR